MLMLTVMLTWTVVVSVVVSGIGFVAATVLPEEAAVAAVVFGSVVAVAVVVLVVVFVFASA
jgi:hypothetical protein